MARPGFKEQLDTLVSRDIAIRFGSAGTLLLMLVQAPIIGSFVGLAWRSQEAVNQTYFIMAVAALWMGCMNACTCIVAEREIFARERMFSLNIWSYLLSKMLPLAAVCAAQAALLMAAQGQLMHLKDSLLVQGLIFLFLTATGVCASALGLLVSAFSRTSYGSVVAVPILLIPQVIFSEVLLQDNINSRVPSIIEKLTLTKWCYEALVNAHNDIEWLVQFKCLAARAASLGLLLALAAGKLKLDDA